jgi:PhoPQ-activated pathogenicity-related protein
MMRYSLRSLLIAPLALVAGVILSSPALADDELGTYVKREDPSYGFQVVRSGVFESGEYVELIMTSQTWRDVPWKHQLFIFRPKRIDNGAKQVLLYIDGGRWNPEYEGGKADLPRTARVFARLAESIRAPVAVLRQVPFQPIFDLREDALIAYTFDRYLKTGDADWPLLLPMVKSAQRAMDTVQTVAARQWHLKVERFTVTGASKRGWTSWLTAANDPRVASVAPMVIDMLNMPEQIRLQRDTFGALSEQVQDYERIDLPKRLESDNGHELLAMVDPYSYRTQLVQPKLILLATNDRYWPLDALSLYWSGLAEPKRVLYVPNQGHGMRDIDRLIGALSAAHRYSVRGESMPTVDWAFATTGGKVEVSVQPGRKPRHVFAWTASSATRDFRDARWSSHDCKITKTAITCTAPATPPQYTALYSEVTFNDRGEAPFSLSTAVCIIDAAGAMVRPCLNNASAPQVTRAH